MQYGDDWNSHRLTTIMCTTDVADCYHNTVCTVLRQPGLAYNRYVCSRFKHLSAVYATCRQLTHSLASPGSSSTGLKLRMWCFIDECERLFSHMSRNSRHLPYRQSPMHPFIVHPQFTKDFFVFSTAILHINDHPSFQFYIGFIFSHFDCFLLPQQYKYMEIYSTVQC